MNENGRGSQLYSFFRPNNAKLLAVVSVLAAVFMVDSQIGYISDFIPERIATLEGIASFIGIAAVFAVGGYMILSYIREKNRKSTIRALHLNTVHVGASIAHYVLIAIVAVVIVQMLAFAQYDTLALYAALFISYGVWIVTLTLLSRAFFAWYKLSDKNRMVLVIALSMIFYVANGVMGIANHVAFLQVQPEVIASDRVAFFPSFDLDSIQQQINLVYQIVVIAPYVLSWIGTVMLLRPYVKRIGKAKLYAILGAAMVYYLINYPLFVLGYFTPTEENDVDVMNNILIFGIADVLSGIIFGAAFLSVARTLQKNTAVREYMMMAAYGFILFYIAGSAMVSQAAYPPFGLASVAFTGLSCYMIYAGLYSAAVTVSLDSRLRQSIRKSVAEQSRFLDRIGTAQMEREVQNNVLTLARKTSDEMMEKSGAQPSMTEDEIKQYVEQVMKELAGKQ
jgi:hypothetical protein